MPDLRTNKILASSGFKGGGKTYQTLKLISKYINPQDGAAPRKVIIFDTNMEYNQSAILDSNLNFKIKTIKISDLLKFNVQQKVEAVRILPVKEDGNMMSVKEKKDVAWSIVQGFRGGLVILEDINNYTLNVTHEEEFVSGIINNAHRNADIAINVQSCNMLNPVLIRNLNEHRFHYESSLPGKDKFQEKWELYMIAKLLIDARFFKGGLNEKFCVWVDNLRFKIKGNFTQAEYALACKKYVEIYAPRLFRQELGRMTGSPQEKTMKAITQAVKSLFIYWGN